MIFFIPRKKRRRYYNVYTRSVQKQRKFSFFENRIFIHSFILKLMPSKWAQLDIMHLCQRFFQSSKHFSNSIFGIAFSSFSDALLMSSMLVKRRPFKVLFSFGNRKTLHGAMSGEYGGWGIVTVLFSAKNSTNENRKAHKNRNEYS